jgi:hypothetical protein
MAPELDKRVANGAVERCRIDAHRDGYRDGLNSARGRGHLDKLLACPPRVATDSS